MAKLHELLAVDAQVKGQAEAARKDLMNTFEKKERHFTRKTITFISNKEGIAPKVEAHQDLQATVRRELKWLGAKLAGALDIGHQVDMGNTLAMADVTLDDGTIILKDIPATSLLQIGHRLKELQEFIASIKTLDPAQGFKADPNMSTEGDTVYKALDAEKVRGDKVFEYVVMVPPTDKFPAQVKELMMDRPIGTILTQEWSGLITTAEKGDMLDRVEEVARAVKQARSRANEKEISVSQYKIGERLLNYVFNATK